MLESLEQSNIKRMSVENPEQQPELVFDPERDITEAQWEDIRKDYQKALNSKMWPAVAMTMARVTIMGMHEKLPVLTQEQKKEMVLDLYNNSRHDIRFAADIKIIDPTMVLSDKLNWLKIREDLELSPEDENYNLYLERLVAAKIVGDIKDLPDPDSIETVLHRIKQDIINSGEEDWYKVADILAKSRLLFPDKKLNISPEDMENMRIEVGVGGGILDAVVSADLTILAAQDARIENGKIVINMSSDKDIAEEIINTIPEQRNF